MTVRLQPVPADMLDHFWPEVEGAVEAAVERSAGRFSSETIHNALQERSMQLWLAVNGSVQALAITEVVTFKTGLKVCSMVIVTGENRESWMPLMDGIKTWAKAEGCDRIEAWARPGWAKITGWKETHRLIEEGL
jgi:hypothetical protein|tara:strand:- start:442 stop:846 length:405 start_codon:yes stop_codon:yes gene_type:complete